MKKRFTACVLAFSMFTSQVSGMVSAAEDGKNTYGHSITYKPVTQLYTGGETVKFFDAGITEWGKLSDSITRSEAESIKWLQTNNYLLNRFGRKFNTAINMPGCFNSKGEWLTQIKGPRNVRRWDANVRFNALVDKEQRENGNISGMYDKGDIQYFFSWKVKTVQTRWGLNDKSNDTGFTLALSEWVSSSGGGWKKYNTLGDGPNLGNFSAWKNGENLTLIGFSARSDKDATVDSYLSGAMLVGRDVKGPGIRSVRVTSDAEGKNEIKNGAITLDTVDKLNERTIYFQVQWDEPVVFNGMTAKELEKLTLQVETIGIDGTSGMIAEAPFLKFAPSKTDGKPVMVFEYKIADPYTDNSAVTQERGYFYRFSKVTVSEKENAKLWNNIYDISGNKFASDENGQQPSGKVATAISGSPRVDLTPFGIKNIRITKKSEDTSAFIENGDLLAVTLELNKPMAANTELEVLPEVTLNVEDPDGNDVVIKPSQEELRRKYYSSFYGDWREYEYFWVNQKRIRAVEPSDDRKAITYYIQLHEGYKMKNGTSVKVTSVSSSGAGIKDECGYSFMNYALNDDGRLSPTDIPTGAKSKIAEYTVAPDKQYKLDYDAPSVEILAADMGNGIISIIALADDISLEGCDAAFTVKVNGSVENDGISYQAAASENYRESEWKKAAAGTLNILFSAPILNEDGKSKAYGFIKLPQRSEADKINISAVIVDEAGNSASAEKEFSAPEWSGFDTLAPSVKASVNQEEISIVISDIDDEITYMYGFPEDESNEPAVYITSAGKSGVLSSPDLPAEGMVYQRVAWIKASDSNGNTSDVLKIPVKFDRTYTAVNYTADTDKTYFPGDYPSAEIKIENAKAYWYMWAEKPAGVPDTAAYISEHFLADMKSRAEILGKAAALEDEDPDTEQSNNQHELTVTLEADTPVVAGINPANESYGENILPDETSRPIVLVLAAEKDDGSTLVKAIEFNTFYSAPKVNVRQNRFSTNDHAGKRVDYVRDGGKAGLLWASDTDQYAYPLNTPNLYGFAQAEIYLAADPVTGLERVDMANSSVTLEKVVYEGADVQGSETERTVIGEWKLENIGLSRLSNGISSAVLDIDPNSLETNYYKSSENGSCLGIRYEFVCNMHYMGGIAPTKTAITYFAFNNTPSGFIHSTLYDTGSWMSQYHKLDNFDKKNVEAIFDQNGRDITSNVPVYTVSTSYPEGYGYKEYICFSAPGGEFGLDSDRAYYGAPVQNTVDMNNTSKLAVHIGTDPDKLSDVLPFTVASYDVLSAPYDVGQYLFGDKDELHEVTLYYRFEHPERGTVSPIYVMKIRRDNVDPVFDISISETRRPTNEVLVKLNALYDTQMASDGTIVIDTPETVLRSGEYMFDAWRAATDNDDLDNIPQEDQNWVWVSYDEDTDTNVYKCYVRVSPDEDGIYHFVSNGYFVPYTVDNAGNRNTSVLVNGESIEIMSGGMDWPCYYITNVDGEPPEFATEPIFTANEGSFNVTAKTDDSVKNVYLKFDKDYSGLLFGETSEESTMYNIKNVPGIISGGFSSENGEIDAEIYVKHSEAIPLSSVTLVIEDSAGNQTEYAYSFTSPLYGKKAEITNTKNTNGYPVYRYGETLDFSVPVKLDGLGEWYSLSHNNASVYSDGITQIEFTDLFGESGKENIYADIFGGAFAHSLIFTVNGEKIAPQTAVSADVKVTIDTSKTKGLSVEGGKTEFTFTENGTLTYSLINSELGQTREFSVPIANIDKTAPEAIVGFHTESEKDVETGVRRIYSATYSIEGFSEDDVILLPSENGAAPSDVTFDYGSENKKYTFRFRDAAGNEGSYTADASEIEFAQRMDNKITAYRLTYLAADENGFRTLGQFGVNDEIKSLGLVNRGVSVKTEALNQNGEVVSATVSVNGDLPDGAAVYAKEKLVMFTSESDAARTVNLTLTGTGAANSINVPVVLPADTIDLTAPTGTVIYMPEENSVKAYLVTNDTDLAENGVQVTGTKIDGTAFELKMDENGYYTELDINGTGRFIMIDKAGNVGSVAIAVLTIDKEPPQVVGEGWQSIVDARTQEAIKQLLETPTNSTIKLFITFNEQLKGAEVKAFKNSEKTEELLPTDEYVTAVTNGCTLTVEFKQNCLAKLTVYDLRGNAQTLWRPEDGPITVIDREIPKPAESYPNRVFDKENNVVTMEYVFADGEEVMLLQDHESGYKNRHTIVFSENGTKILNFTDRAGNVYTDYPVISEVDELAPNIKINMDFVGNGNVLSGNESYMAGNMYTNKDVRILLNVDDETAEGILVEAKTRLGTPIQVKTEKIDLNGKTYHYNFVVSENGSYQIIAKDKWGHKNLIETNVSVIDKTAPTIRFSADTTVLKAGITEDEAKSKILEETAAVDLQSGANSPMGDALETVTDGVTLSVDLSNVKLDKEGRYTVKITAADRLGNVSEKKRTVTVVKDIYIFNVNGSSVYANDVFTASKGKIRILDASETAKYYYAKGHKSAAQMKYAKGFHAGDGFEAAQNGYYTILAQENNRKMYLLYVYIY